MNGIIIDQKDMQAALNVIPENVPVMMVNLLRYEDMANYGDGSYEPCSGREAYFKRYIPVFVELAAEYPEIKPFWFGNVLAGLVIDAEEKWDNFALISYPNFASFIAITESEAYRTRALPHRLAALKDFKLVVAVAANPI